MKRKIDLLNDRSDFVREVLETPPNNIITWGNTFLLVFVLLLLSLSWFVKYPDIVHSEIVLTTNNPPIYLSSTIQGKIDTILKKEEENIAEGDWIAVIGSNADLKNIRTLDGILNTIRKVNYHLALMDSIELPILNLGEIQPSYNNLVKAILTFRHHEIDSNYTIQTQLNALQIQQYNNLISGAKRDRQIAEKELEVAKLDLKRQKKLLEVEAISQKEYELAELAYLQAIRTLEDRESQIIQVEYQKVSLLSQGKNLKYSEEEIFLNSELDILEAIKLTELA